MLNLVVEFRAPTVPVSVNETNGRHWSVLAKRTGPWRDVAQAHLRNARVRGAVPWEGQVPVTVHLALPFAKAARRDPHNYVGTNVKAVVDGMVRAGIVPDDTADWVTVLEPDLVVQPQSPRTATITPQGSST
jgi:hypothetical protein